MAPDLVGRKQAIGSSQGQFAGEAILKRVPESFDVVLGSRTLRGDVVDADLLEREADID